MDLYYSIVAAGHCVIACNMHSCGHGYSSTCTSLAAGLLGLQVAVALTIQEGSCACKLSQHAVIAPRVLHF